MQMAPQPVFRITGKLLDGSTSFSNIQDEGNDVVEAVGDWSEDRCPDDDPDEIYREFHIDVNGVTGVTPRISLSIVSSRLTSETCSAT